MKRIAIWTLSWGTIIVTGVVLREPSVATDDNGEILYADENGVELVRDGLGQLSYPSGEPAPVTGIVELRQSFGEAMADRAGWWMIGLALLAVGAGIWFGLGDKRRRSTFVPAIPLGIGGIGLLISSTWWYKWGDYRFADGAFSFEPDAYVASTTRIPWTIMWFVLVAAYVIGRALRRSGRAARVRPAVTIGWLLSPFVTYWGVLRGPIIDWGEVVSVHAPLWLFFVAVGAVLLWVMTRPGIGEAGRLIAVAILGVAAFTWIGAFFGWFGMLQKIRLSILLLGFAGLLAPNFVGVRRQRLKLVYGWIGFITIFHILVTLMNTDSSIEVPTENFAGGFMVTLYVTAFTLLFSFPFGVLLALARTSRLPLFRVMSTVYIECFRGVPLITMLFFFTVFVNLFLPSGMELSELAAVTIGFTLFSSAYLAENVRGGLQSVRRGQYEASDALGLTTVQRTGFIVLPQALRVSIPPLVGQMLGTYKETSLLSIVGVFDLLLIARTVIPSQTEFLSVQRPAMLFISMIYFIGAYIMSKYSQRLEAQLGVGER